MRFPDGRILVFAKAPVAGRVKTRLIPPLTPAAAAALHRELAERTLATATSGALAPVELWCAPGPDDPFFRQCRRRFGLSLRRQPEGDLGTRMATALEQTLRQSRHAVLIGCDCPVLTPSHLAKALGLLAEGTSLVLGPAEDGGYMLIGARDRIDAALFEKIEWGSERVLEQTRARARERGIGWRELEPLWDLDRPADLERYRRLKESETKNQR